MNYKLRDGSTTADRRLDRIVQFDERSREYPVRKLVGDKDPRSYTWRCNQHLDQGPDGACVGFGVTHELIARPAEVFGLGYADAFNIYTNAKKIDPWEGEDYEGTSVLAGIEVARKMGYMDGYYWAFGLEDLILGVGRKGPAVLGLAWMEEMMEPDVWTNYIYAKGEVVGGHCVLCKAVNIKRQRFTIHNSWGTTWGAGGDCYISFNDMGKLLENSGEAAFFVGRKREL